MSTPGPPSPSAASAPDPAVAQAMAPGLRRSGAVIESVIRGPSMGTTLPDGATIRIHCGPVTGAAPGAVIAFLGRQGPVAHRLVGPDPRWSSAKHLLTRGDAQALWDPPIGAAAVIGVVTGWRRGAADAWAPVPPGPPRHPAAAMADRLVVRLASRAPPVAWAVVAAAIFLGRAARLLRANTRP